VSGVARTVAFVAFGIAVISGFAWLKYVQIRRRPMSGREIVLAFVVLGAFFALAWLADYVGF
jgi:hypothetical protein